MNCIDVRRQLLSEPARLSEQVQSHLQGCAECRHFAKGLVAFEQELKKAAEVPVPEGLASRVLLQQRMQEQGKFPRWGGLAIAAGLLMAVGMVIYHGLSIIQPGLEQSVLAHIENELHHLQDRNNVTLHELNSLLASQGMRFAALNRPVNYAGACQMRRQQGVHLVLESAAGPVTVLLMPGEYIDGRTTIESKRFQGVIIPTENGTMAIVAEQEQEWRQMEQILSNALVPVS